MTGYDIRENEVGFDAGHGSSPGGTGRLIPDATLPSIDGSMLRLDSYRPDWNLVILMLGDGEPNDRCVALLDELAELRAELEMEEARVRRTCGDAICSRACSRFATRSPRLEPSAM